ncbi:MULTISPECIES: YdcF family protein [unclassified Roseitalea]|uniref:YdcF family protein n=1 Tax=unclassified Roseitalea TaxID=2639107 RepID=UPI00273D3281|nr:MULTISPECIES: YdcF family protein [unclassified Roseitalea]
MTDGEHTEGAAGSIGEDAARSRLRPRRGPIRVALWSLALAAALLVIGFASFLRHVHALTPPDVATIEADGIVVLTGGRARLEPAVALLRQMDGARLLVSGVHAELGENTLRRTLGVSEALFACCIDIDKLALNTIGNARHTAQWAAEHGFDRLVVVTNDYHMPRSMLEMHRAMPDVALVAFPVVNRTDPETRRAELADRYRVLAGEYGKFLYALVRGGGSAR